MFAVLFHSDGFIKQRPDTQVTDMLQCRFGSVKVFMITEDEIARGFQFFKGLQVLFDIIDRQIDKIAGDGDHIRLHCIGAGDQVLDEVTFDGAADMDVGELHQGKPVQREIPDPDSDVVDHGGLDAVAQPAQDIAHGGDQDGDIKNHLDNLAPFLIERYPGGSSDRQIINRGDHKQHEGDTDKGTGGVIEQRRVGKDAECNIQHEKYLTQHQNSGNQPGITIESR